MFCTVSRVILCLSPRVIGDQVLQHIAPRPGVAALQRKACSGEMDETFQRQLWNAVPEVPQSRAHEPVSLAESQQRRDSAAAELARLDATLQRNCQVRRLQWDATTRG